MLIFYCDQWGRIITVYAWISIGIEMCISDHLLTVPPRHPSLSGELGRPSGRDLLG
jgi:hypothetical protein